MNEDEQRDNLSRRIDALIADDYASSKPSYHRALNACEQLVTLDKLVYTLCISLSPSGARCAGCIWEQIVKPLSSHFVGWGRGDNPIIRDGSEGIRRLEDVPAKPRETGLTETEMWLRSSEAYDAVTDVWLARLESADPGMGCNWIGGWPMQRSWPQGDL